MRTIGLTLGLSRKRNPQAAAVLQPLRTVATNNRVLTGREASGTRTGQVIRWPYLLGIDATTLCVNLNNWFQGASSENLTGNAMSVEEMIIEYPAGSTFAPVTFAGARKKTLANGDYDINSDELAPSAFGLTSFAKGQVFWIKARLSVPVGGNSISYGPSSVGIASGCIAAWYDPAVTTPSATDAPGIYTASGTAFTTRPTGYYPILLGRPVTDGKSFVAIGDSIAEGANDPIVANALNGHGFISRAMRQAGNNTPVWPCLNLSKSGAVVILNEFRRIALYKYGKYAIDEIGTNNVGNDGSGNTALLKSTILSHWLEMRGAGCEKIIRTTLIPRTTSTDSWATVANQTYYTNWGPGGKGEEMNAWFAARLTDGTIDSVCAMNSILAPEDAWKSKANGTANYTQADGTHPSSQGHEFMAADLRAVLAAMP